MLILKPAHEPQRQQKFPKKRTLEPGEMKASLILSVGYLLLIYLWDRVKAGILFKYFSSNSFISLHGSFRRVPELPLNRDILKDRIVDGIRMRQIYLHSFITNTTKSAGLLKC